MNNTDVLWVGVSLDPSDNPRVPRSRISATHDAIVSAISKPAIDASRTIQEYSSGACIHTYPLGPRMGQLIDVLDAMGFRIGFGIRIADAERGKALIPKVTDLLNRMGVSLPVSVWMWSPASIPSYTVHRMTYARA